MTTPRRPRRRRGPDRLTAPDLHEERGAISCAMILAPLDRLHEAMDAKYGMDRLPELYPVEPGAHVPADKRDAYRAVPERYGLALEALHHALDRNDVEGVRLAVDRAMKLVAVMDRECDRAGVQRPPPHVIETVIDGRRLILVADTRDAAEVERRNPDARVVTLQEAVVAVERMRAGLATLGQMGLSFPDAEFAAVAKQPKEAEDDIPF